MKTTKQERGSPASGERSEPEYNLTGAEFERRKARLREPRGQQQNLLPCPFCGSENVSVEPLVGGFVVDCKDCGGGCGTCHSEEAACEEWNKRKSLTSILKERGIDSDKVESEIRSRIQRSELEDPKEVLDRLAPRGQQQEWSIEDHTDERGGLFLVITGFKLWFPSSCLHELEGIIKAHNAELAAERQRVTEQAGYVEHWFQQTLKSKRQLLSALAAIEKAKHAQLGTEAHTALQNINLSALDKHNAKVREPLVEALTDCATMLASIHVGEHMGDCAGEQCPTLVMARKGFDALAKVKEQ